MTDVPIWKQRFDACLEGADLSTPEGRYAFDCKLRAMLDGIKPLQLQQHYAHFVRQERARVFLAIDKPTARFVSHHERPQ